MKTRHFKLIVFVISFVSIQAVWSQPVRITDEEEIINSQKDIVAKLTGHLPIKGSKKLKSRFTASERKTTADFLSNQLKAIGLKPEKNTYNVKDKKGLTYQGTNIYAEIPSTTGGTEYVILGAHYDTAENSPGAVHNSTGIALAHYVSEEIINLEERTKNYIVVFFDHQEKNMMGCRMFARKLQSDNIAVHSMHRVDYIGWDNDEDRAIEILTSNFSLESVYRLESNVPLYKRTIATAESRIFSKLGFEAVTITAELKSGDSSPFVHQSSDTYTTVNFKYLASISKIVANAMTALLSQ